MIYFSLVTLQTLIELRVERGNPHRRVASIELKPDLPIPGDACTRK